MPDPHEKHLKILLAENQVHAHKLRNDVGKKLLVKLGREGGNMGILPPEIDLILAQIETDIL